MNRSKLTRLFAGFTAALLTAGTLSLGVFAVPAQEDTQIRFSIPTTFIQGMMRQ